MAASAWEEGSRSLKDHSVARYVSFSFVRLIRVISSRRESSRVVEGVRVSVTVADATTLWSRSLLDCLLIMADRYASLPFSERRLEPLLGYVSASSGAAVG